MRRRRRARGFTLIEIAVALAIVGIGMVACMQVFGGSLRLQDRGARHTRAVILARSEMDKLMFDPPLNLSREVKLPGGYRAQLTVREARPPEIPDPGEESQLEAENLPRYVEVDVAWRDGPGEQHYVLKTVALRLDDDLLGKEQ